MIVTAGLGVLVIAEGAYIVRTRSQLQTLTEKVDGMRAAAIAEPEPYRPTPSFDDRASDEPVRGAAAPAPKLPPPRFVTEHAANAPDNGDPLPLPPVIGTPEAREQLRQFVVAQMARERQEARLRDEQRQMARQRERRIAAVQPLGLSGGDMEKFLSITDKADAARADLRQRVESGQLDRQGIRQEMNAIREQSDRDLKALLGDDRMKKLEDIRREQGPVDGGGPGFFGRGFGGGRGNGGFAAAPGGAAQGAAPGGPAAP
jgi:hypothetical protein